MCVRETRESAREGECVYVRTIPEATTTEHRAESAGT